MKSALAEPTPLLSPTPFVSWKTINAKRVMLEVPIEERYANIFDVLQNRRTQRTFGPLSLEKLSELLWFTAKVYRVRERNESTPAHFGPLPTSGACHAVEIVVIRPTDDSCPLSIYDSTGHCLMPLNTLHSMRSLTSSFEKMLSISDGTILLFAADSHKLDSRYRDGESLSWRDSGVLIGGIALVSEALGLAFCPLGCSARTEIEAILGKERFLGVGGGVVGTRVLGS